MSAGRSKRSNFGQAPSYLKDFETDIPNLKGQSTAAPATSASTVEEARSTGGRGADSQMAFSATPAGRGRGRGTTPALPGTNLFGNLPSRQPGPKSTKSSSNKSSASVGVKKMKLKAGKQLHEITSAIVKIDEDQSEERLSLEELLDEIEYIKQRAEASNWSEGESQKLQELQRKYHTMEQRYQHNSRVRQNQRSELQSKFHLVEDELEIDLEEAADDLESNASSGEEDNKFQQTGNWVMRQGCQFDEGDGDGRDAAQAADTALPKTDTAAVPVVSDSVAANVPTSLCEEFVVGKTVLEQVAIPVPSLNQPVIETKVSKGAIGLENKSQLKFEHDQPQPAGGSTQFWNQERPNNPSILKRFGFDTTKKPPELEPPWNLQRPPVRNHQSLFRESNVDQRKGSSNAGVSGNRQQQIGHRQASNNAPPTFHNWPPGYPYQFQPRAQMYHPMYQQPFQQQYSAPQVEAPAGPSADLSQLIGAMTDAFSRVNTGHSRTQDSETAKFVARTATARDLPIFTGTPEQWLMFKSTYDSTTAACKFTPLENLTRLQKCLKGEALQAVQCLLISPMNVAEVMQTLEEHFGQPEHIISALVKKVEALPPVKDDKFETVISFGLSVTNLRATVVALQNQEHLQNPILVKKLEEKLSPILRRDWNRYAIAGAHRKTLEAFADWLKIEVKSARACCPPGNREDDADRKPKGKKVFVTTESSKERKQWTPKAKTCTMCSKVGHKLSRCEDFIKLQSHDRWKFVREKNLCIGCLNSGHMFKDCRSKVKCNIEECGKLHHKLLHSAPKENVSSITADVDAAEKTKQPQDQSAQVATSLHTAKSADRLEDTQVHLLIVPVKLRGPNGTLSTFAMLDGGSTTTLIRQDIADKLGLNGKRGTLVVQDLTKKNSIESSVVNLDILTSNEERSFHLKNVRTMQRLPLPYQSVRRKVIRRWKHLNGINLEPYEGAQPTILIGQDNSNLTMPFERRVGPPNAPMAVLTELGWILTGNVQGGNENFSFPISAIERDEELHEMVKRYFSVESFGVKMIHERPRSVDDKRAQSIMDCTIKRIGNKWEAGLLWRYDNIKFPENYSVALRRLQLLEKKMQKDPELAEAYSKRIEEYIEKGYAFEASGTGMAASDKSFFIPHFSVVNPRKKKLRLVFDAASKANGTSLNDMLLEGPDKLVPLPDILMKFRQRKVAVSADIAEMFHQVSIRHEDNPAQQFLFRGTNYDRPPDVFFMKAMIFGACCSPTIAQEVKNRNAEEFREVLPQAVDAIIKKHYVDDYLDSFDSVEEASKVIGEVIDIHLKGGFNIRNWISSHQEALGNLSADMIAPVQLNFNINMENDASQRVLGLYWQPQKDKFTFRTEFFKVREAVVNGSDVPTKREALSLIMSVFDPLGFLAHHMIKAKIVLQETWKLKIGWDDQLSSGLMKTWKAWLDELKSITSFTIPRCYSNGFSQASEVQLHVFVDASEKAYASVAYFRFLCGEDWSMAFIMAKTHVAPLKGLSIVKMELQAALMGSRMSRTIQAAHEVKIHRQFFWSDNRTVLKWITSESTRFQVFVCNRVGEIQELTNPLEWNWIPTAQNVADEATRAEGQSDWTGCSRWVNGPGFLLQDESYWPKLSGNEPEVPEDSLEIKKKYVMVTRDLGNLQATYFSRYTKLIRVTAWIRRYLWNIKKGTQKKTGELDVKECEEAELWWYRHVQEEHYQEEISELQKQQPVSKKSDLYRLNPFVDEDGVLKCGSRLTHSSLVPLAMKTPIILPRKHPFTKLVVKHYHEKCRHHGLDQIINSIRQRYSIAALRQEVKKAGLECLFCKMKKCKPVNPQMAPLPDCRLAAYQRPFTMTGLDYFGPLGVTIGRRHEKRYGALFTCLTTRAVHLELAASLSTDSCIMAIRRFAARRGDPKKIYSDNGTNFVGAERELREAVENLDQTHIKSELCLSGIEWHFNPPFASSMGGSWERMVRSVKTALKTVLKEHFPREEVLQTLFTEAERLVNGHPLTYASTHEEDEPALTPNNFLLGTADGSQPIGQFSDKDLCLRKLWRQSMRLADHFWSRWTKEFLPTLANRQKWHDVKKNLEIGDLGLMIDELRPRDQWPLGKIVEVIHGRDGTVRSVKIKTAAGTYHRPVNKVCVFDKVEGLGHPSAKPGVSVLAPHTRSSISNAPAGQNVERTTAEASKKQEDGVVESNNGQ